jgi:hypothetical protein
MKLSIERLVAIGSIALIALLVVAGAAVADTYTTDLESPPFTTGTVNGQDGWHSAAGQPAPSIPALPNGYDQEVVDSSYGGQFPAAFGGQALRVSNYQTEQTGEFEYQTYSKSTTQNAGENETNRVFDATFKFIPTMSTFQEGLQINVSPDDGHGGRMSFVSLTDVQDGTNDGIQITFYDPVNGFVDAGTYSRTQVHTIRFLIEFKPDAPDVLRLIVDGKDIGDLKDLCLTTWENFYGGTPPVTNSLEFRADNSQNTNGQPDCNLNGATLVDLGAGLATCQVNTLAPETGPHGYLFDDVTTVTRDSAPPAPTVCGVPEVGKITPTGTTCSQYRDNLALTLDKVVYTTKGNLINSVSPGVFFYYTKITDGTAGGTVTITETNDSAYTAIPVQQGQAFLYEASSCTKLKWSASATTSSDGTTATVTGNLPSGANFPASGDFIIGVKYDAAALQKKQAPALPPVTYSFETKLDGGLVDTGASVLLDKK